MHCKQVVSANGQKAVSFSYPRQPALIDAELLECEINGQSEKGRTVRVLTFHPAIHRNKPTKTGTSQKQKFNVTKRTKLARKGDSFP